MLQTGMIVGGWDKYEGGKIYGIPLGGTIVEQPFAIGGKPFIPLYLLLIRDAATLICCLNYILLSVL